MVKKALLIASVVITFVLYSLHQRGDSSANVVPTVQTTRPSTSTPSPSVSNGYKDGSYTGAAADALYGYIQVETVVSGGRITDVMFLQSPNSQRNSIEINAQAMPLLKQQVLQIQSAQVDGVSGATDTSQAFIQSLGDALRQAKA